MGKANRGNGPRIAALFVAWALSFGAAGADPAPAPSAPERLDNAVCLGCHANDGFSTTDAAGKPRNLQVHGDKFEKSVHGKRQCQECHQDITEIPHKPGQHKVGCVQCHDDLWKKAQREGKEFENARLGWVVDRINHYMGSVHARPSRADQSRTNAGCYSCHDPHYVYPPGSNERAEWRMKLPETCGACHTKQLA